MLDLLLGTWISRTGLDSVRDVVNIVRITLGEPLNRSWLIKLMVIRRIPVRGMLAPTGIEHSCPPALHARTLQLVSPPSGSPICYFICLLHVHSPSCWSNASIKSSGPTTARINRKDLGKLTDKLSRIGMASHLICRLRQNKLTYSSRTTSDATCRYALDRFFVPFPPFYGPRRGQIGYCFQTGNAVY